VPSFGAVLIGCHFGNMPPGPPDSPQTRNCGRGSRRCHSFPQQFSEVGHDAKGGSPLGERCKCATLRASPSGPLRRSIALRQAVANGGCVWQASGAQRVIIRRGHLQQKIGAFKQSRSLPRAYLSLHRRGPGRGLATPGIRTRLAWCGIPLPLFSWDGGRTQAPLGRLTSRPTLGSASTDIPRRSDRRAATWSAYSSGSRLSSRFPSVSLGEWRPELSGII
jgi:hypothetical protein